VIAHILAQGCLSADYLHDRADYVKICRVIYLIGVIAQMDLLIANFGVRVTTSALRCNGRL
jgi:hypothetical protein